MIEVRPWCSYVTIRLVHTRDVLMEESKQWNWTQWSVQHEQDTFRTVLEEYQQIESTNTQNEEPFEKNVRRSARTRTESTRLAGYERFPYQAIDADGDFIEEVTMVVEL